MVYRVDKTIHRLFVVAHYGSKRNSGDEQCNAMPEKAPAGSQLKASRRSRRGADSDDPYTTPSPFRHQTDQNDKTPAYQEEQPHLWSACGRRGGRLFLPCEWLRQQKHNMTYSVCVCFLPIHSGHRVRWTYQPGSHRRKVTQDLSSTFFLRCVP